MFQRTVVAVVLCLVAFAAFEADAACQICFPNCTDAAQGVDGKTKCASTSAFCKLEGNSCKGGTSSCDCGTMGCEPCDIVCSPSAPPAGWLLTKVEVTTPQVSPEWRLVAVSVAPRARRS